MACGGEDTGGSDTASVKQDPRFKVGVENAVTTFSCAVLGRYAQE